MKNKAIRGNVRSHRQTLDAENRVQEGLCASSPVARLALTQGAGNAVASMLLVSPMSDTDSVPFAFTSLR